MVADNFHGRAYCNDTASGSRIWSNLYPAGRGDFLLPFGTPGYERAYDYRREHALDGFITPTQRKVAWFIYSARERNSSGVIRYAQSGQFPRIEPVDDVTSILIAPELWEELKRELQQEPRYIDVYELINFNGITVATEVNYV